MIHKQPLLWWSNSSIFKSGIPLRFGDLQEMEPWILRHFLCSCVSDSVCSPESHVVYYENAFIQDRNFSVTSALSLNLHMPITSISWNVARPQKNRTTENLPLQSCSEGNHRSEACYYFNIVTLEWKTCWDKPHLGGGRKPATVPCFVSHYNRAFKEKLQFAVPAASYPSASQWTFPAQERAHASRKKPQGVS